jgi:hypothetical protein
MNLTIVCQFGLYLEADLAMNLIFGCQFGSDLKPIWLLVHLYILQNIEGLRGKLQGYTVTVCTWDIQPQALNILSVCHFRYN